jgi:transketolase N-terminal domain/subunit
MQTTSNVAELAAISKRMGRQVIEMVAEAKPGPPRGSLSAVEPVVALFFALARKR